MPINFSPFTRRLARRRHRLTSRRGGIILAVLLAVAVGGAFLYWRWQVQEALEANAPDQSMVEECLDLAEAGDIDGESSPAPADADEANLAAQLQKCEEMGLGGEE